MNVRELLEQLSSAAPRATVLLLPAHRDATGAEILRTVFVPRLPWMHERQRRHGAVDDFFHAGELGPSTNFDEATDEAFVERVVLLISSCDNFDLHEEPAPKGLLSMARVRENAAQHRRQMFKNGELLFEADFRATLGVSKKRLAAMLGDGRVFALDVEGQKVYPAILCDARLNLKRLWHVAKIIMPAPPESRLDLLTRECGALGNNVPVEMLDDDTDYRSLRRFARAWATEFSRTVVKFYGGRLPERRSNAEPLYECAVEMDPRRPLWARALSAIQIPGYQRPHNIPRARKTMVIIVERHRAGQTDAVFEARLVCHLDGRVLAVTAETAGSVELPVAHKFELSTKRPTVTEVAEAVFGMLSKLR